jgi:FSR family fosmidomycin resistance protein-like MFS transporter
LTEKESGQAADPGRTVFGIVLAISFCHMLNDMMQSLLTAIYPTLKAGFNLTFTQIGLVSLVYQVTASLLQPSRSRGERCSRCWASS